MEKVVRIPIFPLSILPLPGELVPLHIFEPRYRQLLQDIETKDVSFGIYFAHEMNVGKIGSLMKLESVLKRYAGGESDIIVKCEDNFTLDMLLRKFKDREYPGGDVSFWKTDASILPSPQLYGMFLEYLKLRKISEHVSPFTLYQVAQELNPDLGDRYKFLQLKHQQKEKFLVRAIHFQTHLLNQEERSKDLYHLN